MRVLLRGRSGAGPRVLSRFPDCIFKSLSKKHRLIGVAALAATLSTPVLAADMGVPPPLPPTPVYSWTEFYFGGNIGWGQGNASWCSGEGGVVCSTNTYAASPTGTIAGGQFGFRWQSPSNIVIGAEVEVDASNLSQQRISPAVASQLLTTTLTTPQTADIQIGYAFNRFLVYGKGGYAAIEAEFSALNPTVTPGISLSHTGWLNGWNVGGGLEYMLFSHLSLGVEYNYYQFSNSNISNLTDNAGIVTSCGFCGFGTTSAQSVTARLNIKLWPWGP
jgi:outer membrane immunogenic protein